MKELVLAVHVFVVVAIIGLVLVQQGKGSEIGAALGSGASNTMFGSTGNLSFLAKLTACLGIIFFATSLFLGIRSGKDLPRESVNVSFLK